MSESTTGTRCKRDRQPNWTPREEILFISGYIDRVEVIEGEFSGCGVGGKHGLTRQSKDEAWKSLLEVVNSNSIFPRNIDQLKRKLAQIKCSAHKKIGTNQTQTGGGKGVTLSDAEELYIQFLKNRNSSTLSGIRSGTDIGFSSSSPIHTAVSLPMSPLPLTTQLSPVASCSYNVNEPTYIFEVLDKDSECNPQSKKTMPAKRNLSLYDEFLQENIKVQKLKQRKLELQIKKLEKEE